MTPSQTAPTLVFENAHGGTTLCVSGSQIVEPGSSDGAADADTHIDLRGDCLMPGLINAHDHLTLNGFGSAANAAPYRSARDWIADVVARRREDATFAAVAQRPRMQRLLAGALKNLLSGVTTVAHHDPLYSELTAADFPINVVRHYGWSHSLDVDGARAVQRAFAETPDDAPWIIHAAEGLDAAAHAEFDQLDALGCIGQQTLLVHGVALDAAQRARLIESGAGLIWCPSSNLTLLGHTADVRDLLETRRLGIGTDSRLSGSRDLLTELGVAHNAEPSLDAARLVALATRDNATLLRTHDRGELRPGARADLLVLPCDKPPGVAQRSDVRMVMVGGRMLYGDRDYALQIGRETHWIEVLVDGRPKVLDRALAGRLRVNDVEEFGLSWPARELAA